jgi:hypothetical protein
MIGFLYPAVGFEDVFENRSFGGAKKWLKNERSE